MKRVKLFHSTIIFRKQYDDFIRQVTPQKQVKVVTFCKQPLFLSTETRQLLTCFGGSD